MNDNNEILPINDIRNQIFSIRGQQGMIDRDLADLYQDQTKHLNKLVKRNIDRFPEAFCFQLTDEENEIFRSQNVTKYLKPHKIKVEDDIFLMPLLSKVKRCYRPFEK